MSESADVWNITIDNTYIPSTTYPNSDFHICDSYCNHTTYPTYYYTNYTTWPSTIYMYQIQCPSCKKMNWAELEKTVECKTSKCKAKLRAVTSKPEHIIEVET